MATAGQATNIKADDLPMLLRHQALAIFKDLRGKERDRFLKAIGIARWAMVKNGHAMPGSDDGSLAKVRLTSDGRRRDAVHRREAPSKARAFEVLYERYRADIEAATMETGQRIVVSRDPGK